MASVFVSRCCLSIVFVLIASISHANSDGKTPMYFSDLEGCANDSVQRFNVVPHLFQKVDSLQLRTNTRKDIPRLTLAEFNSSVPIEHKSILRGSIAGMDIKDNAKIYTGVFDRESELKPDVVIEGVLGKDGSIADLSIKKLHSAVKSIALRSKETVNGNLTVTALDDEGAPVTEYKYTPYQIVYLKKESDYEERLVNVSTQTCSEENYFVSRLGSKLIRHDRSSVPFRIFLAVSDPVKYLSISFKSNTLELAVPGLAGL